ncbi:Retrovirus-related Pol polyprotein from transposon RE1 [Linum perenne]
MSSSETTSTATTPTISPPSNPQISIKLTPTNYLLWKAQIQPLLHCHNLMGHVTGEAPAPSVTIAGAKPNPAYAVWFSKDQLVLSWITLSVSEAVLPQLIGLNTSYEAWQRLSRIYASGSKVQIRQLKLSLYELSRNGESISTYLQRAKTIADQLGALGDPVSDDDLVSHILHGLDEIFRPFARSMESRHDSLSYDDLHSLLLSEELQLKRHHRQSADLSATALHAHGGRGSRGGRGRGSWRGGRGRAQPQPSRFYPSNQGGLPSFSHAAGILGSSPSGHSDVVCYNCGGKGHIRPDCPSPKPTYTRPNPNPTANLATSPAQPGSSQQWVMDSGTNHHLTADLSNIVNHTEYSGTEEVTFGNGQMILSPSTAAADATSAPTPLPTPHRPTPHRPTPQITLQNPPPPTFPNDPPLGPSSPTSPNTPTLGPPTTPPTLSPEHSFTSLLPSSPPTSPTPPSATIPPPPSTTIPPPTSSLNTHPMITRSRTGSLKPRTFLASTTLPSTVCQALSRPAWRAAMSEELNALLRNHTWDLVLPPPTANVISNKWVFRVKEKADGSIERFKARLVARGFQQVEGVDYNDTFSPVLKPATLRLILSLAVTHSWPLHQIDISNAFLHGSITEELYMTQPQGFVDPDKPNHVCRLRKSLYGLKQAPRAWYACLATALEEFGFMASKTDTSLFIYTGAGVCLYLLVYIDDIIITGHNASRGLISQPTEIHKGLTTQG